MLPFFFAGLIQLLKLPYMLRYILDVAWVLLLGFMLMARRRGNRAKTGALSLLIVFFFLYTAFIYIMQYQSVFYYLWGVRNNFRFFIAFFACAAFLKEESVSYYDKAFNLFFWGNVAVSLVQYFALDLKGDFLGGIFGVERGANGYTLVFFTIVATNTILSYLEKKEKLGPFLIKSAAALLIAALAELKFFFVVFIMILILATLFTNFTWRKFWAIFGGIAAVLVFSALLESLFPFFKGFLSLESILESATSDKGYTGDGDLNRLNAIPIINEQWLTNTWQRLLGFGLGNCDYAGFDFLVTPFFDNYGEMHYTWLSYAFLYLETGWIGMAFFYGFFILTYVQIQRIENRSEGKVKSYCRVSRILTICCIAISIYNAALRTEAGYMMFFTLAIPFALDREARKKTHENNKKMVAKNTI